MNKPIPQEWIKMYVDQLLEAAALFGPGVMRDAALSRAEHVMDMVESFRNTDEQTTDIRRS